MNATYQAVAIALLLFPGYIARWIYSSIRYRQNTTDFQAFIEMVIWTAAVSVLFGITGESVGLVSFSNESAPIIYLKPSIAFAAKFIAFSVVFPGLVAWVIENGIIHRVLRFATKQDMSAKQSMWEKFFSENEKYVFVHLKDGRMIFGFPAKYSKDSSEGMFVLSNSRWVKRKDDGINEYTNCIGSEIFIVNKSEIAFIESSNYPEPITEGETGERDKKEPDATAAKTSTTTSN